MLLLKTLADYVRRLAEVRVKHSGNRDCRTMLPYFFKSTGSAGIAMLIIASVVSLSGGAEAQSKTPAQICATMPNFRDQAQCLSTISASADMPVKTTDLAEGWRLIETTDPQKHNAVVSVNHVSDISRSDLDMAGFSLHCLDVGVEAAVIMIAPLPKGAPLAVRVKSNASDNLFETSVKQQGETIILQSPTPDTIVQAWQTSPQLSIEIGTKPHPTIGVIQTAGLPAAWLALKRACSKP